jgi:hypothetical protein
MNKKILVFVAIATLSAVFGAYVSVKKQSSVKSDSAAVESLMKANLPDTQGQTHAL